jgi:hypothetical protein
MVRKIVFTFLLAAQLSVVANLASAIPPPKCFPCSVR